MPSDVLVICPWCTHAPEFTQRERLSCLLALSAQAALSGKPSSEIASDTDCLLHCATCGRGQLWTCPNVILQEDSKIQVKTASHLEGSVIMH